MINIFLYQILASTIHQKIYKILIQKSKKKKKKKKKKKNTLEISAPASNDKFELFDRSYLLSDI